MLRWPVSLWVLILVGLCAPGWALQTFSQRILLPDGTPAAGAAITVRLLRAEKRIFEELRAVTDARGIFTASGTVETDGITNLRAGYLLVDAPGCVLTVAELPVLRAGASPGTLRLSPDCPYTCKVVNEAGDPMAGALISVIQLGGTDSWGTTKALLNAPNMALATPALTAKTGKDGAFSLRGATMVDDEHLGTAGKGSFTPGKLVAFVETPTGLLAGETDMIFRPACIPAGNPPKAVVVAPTLVVRGTVINSDTNTAVVNAEVTFAGESIAAGVLPAAKTDARGTFEYFGIPRMSYIYAVADHPSTTSGWTPVTQRLKAADKALLTRQVIIKLKSLVNVSGTLADAATGQPPITPAVLTAVGDDGVRLGSVTIGRDSTSASVPAGRLAMKMAVGRNRLELTAPGYTLAEESTELYVAPDGLRNLTLKAVRVKGFLVKFTTDHPDGFFGARLQVRTATGQVLTAGGAMAIRPDGWWFAPVGDLGDTVEMHVLRAGQEVLPWTTLSADPAKPPATIAVK
jgi:hypothetical protein